MKKLIMILVSGVCYTSLITNHATAQSASDVSFAGSKMFNPAASGEGEKRSVSDAMAPVDKTTLKEMKANLKAAKANLRVTDHFSKNFKNVSDLKWSSEEKVTVATFKINEKSARVVYDKRGAWLYSIISYYQDQMPGDIKSLVEANYKGFAISLVQEISQDPFTVFMVHLEDCTSLKQILVCNGEITGYADYIKSK